MAMSDKLIYALNKTIKLAGNQVRVRYFDTTLGSVWDDESTLAQSGTSLWTSGVIFSLNSREGSNESVLVQQGKLIDSDKKLYLDGGIPLTGSTQLVDVQIGSPTGELYTTIPDGTISQQVNGVPVYQKSFIRRLTGSLI